jgi:hypothetical protein
MENTSNRFNQLANIDSIEAKPKINFGKKAQKRKKNPTTLQVKDSSSEALKPILGEAMQQQVVMSFFLHFFSLMHQQNFNFTFFSRVFQLFNKVLC